MKSRPILFSAPMVRALLDGRKTQTRRSFSEKTLKLFSAAVALGEISDFLNEPQLGKNDLGYVLDFCPYGKIGDELWVRETWSKAKSSLLENELFYRADGEHQSGRQRSLNYVERESKWRPSIHMPRWASRITLEITGVKVERLQDISTADCYAEGCYRPTGYGLGSEVTQRDNARSDFKDIWESINGAGSWAQNPWLWCISFRMLTT